VLYGYCDSSGEISVVQLASSHADIAFTMLGATNAVIASLLSDATDQLVRVQTQPGQRTLLY
jgi:hypothetical protein